MDVGDNNIVNPPSILKKTDKGGKGQDPPPSDPTKSPKKKKSKNNSKGGNSGEKSKGGKSGEKDNTSRGRGRSRETHQDKGKTPRGRSGSTRSASRTPAADKNPKDKTPANKVKETYAEKAKVTPKTPSKKKVKRLKYQANVKGSVAMKKSNQLRQELYRRLCTLITTCQSAQGAKTCRVMNYAEPDETPLSNPGQMPSLHVEVSKYFCFSAGNRQWNGNTIPADKTRKMEFSCLLEADIPIEEIVETV